MLKVLLTTPFILTGLSLLLSGCDRMPSGLWPQADDSGAQLTAKQPRVVETPLPLATKHLSCEAIKAGSVVTIEGHTKLAPNCDLTGQGVRFILNRSNTSLDCNGARLSPANANTNKSALTIRPKSESAIANIQIANCHIEGYGHALHIRQKSNPNRRYTSGLTDPAANRALAPHNIQIINVSSRGSKNSGIFVGDHVHHVTFDRLYLARSGTVGLYLEFGSQFNIIKNSVFVDNGHRHFKPNREAIAVDSSAFNLIQNNTFVHNGAGSIYLYRNCFEHADDPSRSNHFKRTQSAKQNVIRGNIFRQEPVGVWVASRQSRNLKGFECGAYLLAQSPLARYHIDSAKNNRINNNTFIQVDSGIIVEDDGTQIVGNDFTEAGGVGIKVGSKIREKYAAAHDAVKAGIRQTIIQDNRWPEGGPNPQQLQISPASQSAIQWRTDE